MITIFVNIERDSCRTVFLALWTDKSFSLKMTCFHVHVDNGGSVGGEVTFSTGKLAVIPPVYTIFNSLSDIFKGKYTFYLFISSMLITSAMNNKGIFSFTKFLTNLAIISQWGYMVNLNMIPYICKVLALVSTVCALPFTTKNIFHCFGVHQHFHIL